MDGLQKQLERAMASQNYGEALVAVDALKRALECAESEASASEALDDSEALGPSTSDGASETEGDGRSGRRARLRPVASLVVSPGEWHQFLSYYDDETEPEADESAASGRAIERAPKRRQAHPELGEPAPFERVVRWRFDGIEMLLGSDTVVYSREGAAGASARGARPRRRPAVTEVAALDMWLENTISGADDAAICYHKDGHVMGYQLVRTRTCRRCRARAPQALAPDGDGATAVATLERAKSILRFVQRHCTDDAATVARAASESDAAVVAEAHLLVALSHEPVDARLDAALARPSAATRSARARARRAGAASAPSGGGAGAAAAGPAFKLRLALVYALLAARVDAASLDDHRGDLGDRPPKPRRASRGRRARAGAVWKSNLQPDFNALISALRGGEAPAPAPAADRPRRRRKDAPADGNDLRACAAALVALYTALGEHYLADARGRCCDAARAEAAGADAVVADARYRCAALAARRDGGATVPADAVAHFSAPSRRAERGLGGRRANALEALSMRVDLATVLLRDPDDAGRRALDVVLGAADALEIAARAAGGDEAGCGPVVCRALLDKLQTVLKLQVQKASLDQILAPPPDPAHLAAWKAAYAAALRMGADFDDDAPRLLALLRRTRDEAPTLAQDLA
ncbi:hypothetical protein SO694_0000754 [Aureococcus anophagefferens]|uniref:EDRF1 N-terminal domain-containing protein n=1 Tax=Aureococcus anophagefferens TaxID=44056 RepID=A0ABR1GBG8_AURAN